MLRGGRGWMRGRLGRRFRDRFRHGRGDRLGLGRKGQRIDRLRDGRCGWPAPARAREWAPAPQPAPRPPQALDAGVRAAGGNAAAGVTGSPGPPGPAALGGARGFAGGSDAAATAALVNSGAWTGTSIGVSIGISAGASAGSSIGISAGTSAGTSCGTSIGAGFDPRAVVGPASATGGGGSWTGGAATGSAVGWTSGLPVGPAALLALGRPLVDWLRGGFFAIAIALTFAVASPASPCCEPGARWRGIETIRLDARGKVPRPCLPRGRLRGAGAARRLGRAPGRGPCPPARVPGRARFPPEGAG